MKKKKLCLSLFRFRPLIGVFAWKSITAKTKKCLSLTVSQPSYLSMASNSNGGWWWSLLVWGCFVALQWYAARGTRQMIRGGIQVPREPVTWPTRATWRQRQMAWVPALAVGISVISLSARQGEHWGGEKNARAVHLLKRHAEKKFKIGNMKTDI